MPLWGNRKFLQGVVPCLRGCDFGRGFFNGDLIISVKEEMKQDYVVPEVGIYEALVQSVVCLSPNGETERYNEGDTGGWYN